MYCILIALPTNNFIVALSKEMGEFQEKLDTIQLMINSPLKARHWEIIQQLPGNKVVNPTILTIHKLAHLKVVYILYKLNTQSMFLLLQI